MYTPRKPHPDVDAVLAATPRTAPRPPKTLPTEERRRVRDLRRSCGLNFDLRLEAAKSRIDQNEARTEPWTARPTSGGYKGFETPSSKIVLRRRLESARATERNVLRHYFDKELRLEAVAERRITQKFEVLRSAQRAMMWMRVVCEVTRMTHFMSVVKARQTMSKSFAFYFLSFVHRRRARKEREAWLAERAQHVVRPTVSFFQDQELFRVLDKPLLEELISALTVTSHRAGTMLMSVGQTQTAMCILESGSLKTTDKRKVAAEMESLVSTRGYVFGACAVLSMDRSTMSVEATTDVDIWELSHINFQRIMSAYATATAGEDGAALPASISTHFNTILCEVQKDILTLLDPLTTEVVRSHSLLMREWSDVNLQKVLVHFQPLTVPVGTEIITEKSAANKIYLVVVGKFDRITGRGAGGGNAVVGSVSA
eukprot:PhM_4_TR10230/c1_g1_i1/m.89015